MSKKLPITDPFQPKITRNDRFAQMSHQEKVIEQKKKEIQAKLDAKQKVITTETTTKSASPTPKTKTTAPSKKNDIRKSAGFNLFSNDGSFLNTFKQLKDKKSDSKQKSHRSKDSLGGNKSSRWSQRRRSPSPKTPKPRVSRFSDKTNFEPKITINTSFNNAQYNVEPLSLRPQNMAGQPLLKNLIPPPGVIFPTVTPNNCQPVIAAPPLLLNVPPPQILQSSTLLLPNSAGNLLVSASGLNVTIPVSTVLTTLTLPPPSVISCTSIPGPPPCSIPAVELASIPPPNPIQVQNIPQPEPLNALNIPHPAPIQVQNIPTPTSMLLNEIPNPKPLDLLAIPTPSEDNAMSDPDFIKNIPPPNKSIPPPGLSDANVSMPPPNQAIQATCLPPPSLSVSLTPTQSLTVQSIAPVQNILVHTLPPSQLQGMAAGVPPPSISSQGTFSVSSISVGVVSSSVSSAIPSLMAQPILPPLGMGVATVNVSCPPPMLSLQQAPPSFVNQPPPRTSQMPPMNIPPPQSMGIIGAAPIGTPFRDINAVFPPGTPDYEAMASLGRMVVQCGQGIEDVVRQRKTQDPNLWFLFHKESAAYQQYLRLIDQFRREVQEMEASYKPEDIYEPEMAIEEDGEFLGKQEFKREFPGCFEGDNAAKRKRKSRWGDKDSSVPPPTVVIGNASAILAGLGGPSKATSGGVLISRLTRTDPGLLQYAITTYGSTDLTDEDWKKAEDHYKINLLYQDMIKKREELERLQQQGKHKYDYDSDEEIDGGTWEHKLRDKEMMATQLWAQELTKQAEGKHHIGDFLPPEEFKRFMEKTTAKEGPMPSFSDYKEFKIKEDNIGFKMLQKLGWEQGQGLGSNGAGIVDPVNKAAQRDQNQGLGLGEDDADKEDAYEAYRKRMMLAYRFRPNPLNNPRRPYY